MMTQKNFDYSLTDSQAMPVTPVAPDNFDLPRYEAFALAADQRFAKFLARDEGVAVWQRVRAAEVFKDGCKDMQDSLRMQLGTLEKTMDYLTDAPTYLEPWYGIGVTASAFGGEYDWPEGQAPVIRPLYRTLESVPDLVPCEFSESTIIQHSLEMIEYFLDKTQGLLPISWTDLQHPINVATEFIDTSAFFMGTVTHPEKISKILEAITNVLIDFTKQQSELLGDTLARPGHGFASSRVGKGIGLSTDNLVMISPQTYNELCAGIDRRIGLEFGGLGIHSCGNWAKWVPTVRKNPTLSIIDAAFTAQTDPSPNTPHLFRDHMVDSGVVLHTRMVGQPLEVLEVVRALWSPGIKLIVTIYEQDIKTQHQLYKDIHAICS